MGPGTRRLAHAVAVVLAAVGILAAVQRALDVLEAPAPGELSSTVRGQVAQTAAFMGFAPGTAEHRELERQTVKTLAKYHESPRATYLHMAAGSFVLALALLQFSTRLRSRRPRLHRWSGRIILAMVMGAALSGMYFAVVAPIGGRLETGAGLLFGGFFVAAAALGWRAIRRGRPAAHREWMIRMFAAALAVAVMRVGLVAALAFTDLGLAAFEPEVFGTTLWIGWLATLAAAEVYIRATRARPPLSGEAPLRRLDALAAFQDDADVAVALQVRLPHGRR